MTQRLASDEQLMREIARGSHDCLEVLVRRHANGLLTFIQRTIGDLHRSEEVFQEVVSAVWEKRDQYHYPKPLKPWLYKIAFNRCRLDLRKRDHTTSALTGELAIAQSDTSPVEAAVAVETADLVKVAVARLPAQQRTVVVLRIWNGLSYSEIAEIIGATQATARSYMFHALNSLRDHIGPKLL